MRPLIIRIALNSLATALILAAIGYVFAEMATSILATTKRDWHAAQKGASEIAADQLRTRMPLMMAVGGVVIVIVGELIRYALRGTPPAKKLPENDAVKLLDELLQQVEDAEKAKQAEAAKPPADGS